MHAGETWSAAPGTLEGGRRAVVARRCLARRVLSIAVLRSLRLLEAAPRSHHHSHALLAATSYELSCKPSAGRPMPPTFRLDLKRPRMGRSFVSSFFLGAIATVSVGEVGRSPQIDAETETPCLIAAEGKTTAKGRALQPTFEKGYYAACSEL